MTTVLSLQHEQDSLPTLCVMIPITFDEMPREVKIFILKLKLSYKYGDCIHDPVGLIDNSGKFIHVHILFFILKYFPNDPNHCYSVTEKYVTVYIDNITGKEIKECTVIEKDRILTRTEWNDYYKTCFDY